MKKYCLFASVSLLLFSCVRFESNSISDDALASELTTPEGGTKTFGQIIESHKGKPIVVEFWASWCGDCVKAMPQLKKLQADHPEAAYVFISLDKTAEKWQQGIAKHELRGDHYLVSDPEGMKGAFGQSVDLDWIPRYMIFNKDGSLALYRAIETDFDQIDNTLNSLK